ncbi:hypothetical protein MMC06_004253 [Schaereria dolodes]|nr:hypothetical protein [Schaereria dolodes]
MVCKTRSGPLIAETATYSDHPEISVPINPIKTMPTVSSTPAPVATHENFFKESGWYFLTVVIAAMLVIITFTPILLFAWVIFVVILATIFHYSLIAVGWYYSSIEVAMDWVLDVAFAQKSPLLEAADQPTVRQLRHSIYVLCDPNQSFYSFLPLAVGAAVLWLCLGALMIILPRTAPANLRWAAGMEILSSLVGFAVLHWAAIARDGMCLSGTAIA